MKEKVYNNQFSELAIANLNKTTFNFFESWKYVEIIDTLFYKDENEKLTAEPIIRTKEIDTHQITLEFHKSSESWNYIPNSVRNFNQYLMSSEFQFN